MSRVKSVLFVMHSARLSRFAEHQFYDASVSNFTQNRQMK